MGTRIADWLGKILLAIVSFLVFFALLEGFAWLRGVSPLVDDENYRRRDEIRDCRWNAAAPAAFCSPERFPKEGRTSVFALGGSSMQGLPYGDERTITYYMKQRLDERYPDEYAVFNRGVYCKDSIFVMRCFEKLLAPSPT